MGSLLVGWIYPGIVVDQRLRGPVPHYPDPQLQTDPARDLRRFVAGEMAELNRAAGSTRRRRRAYPDRRRDAAHRA